LKKGAENKEQKLYFFSCCNEERTVGNHVPMLMMSLHQVIRLKSLVLRTSK